MTQDEIIEMAEKAGMFYRSIEEQFANPSTDGVFIETLREFAKLVAEKECEACAKLFDARNTGTGFYEPHEPAEIIRARGQE